MNNQPVFVIFRNKSFLCRMADAFSPVIFKFHDIVDLPNVPFYQHIWCDFKKFKSTFGKFFRNELTGNNLAGMVMKNICYLAAADDMLEFEKALAVEFFMQTCCRKVNVKPECLLLAPQEKEYIAVTRTCRMFVLTHIQAGSVENRLYLRNEEYKAEELQGFINGLTDDREGRLPIFLNGENLEAYRGLGLYVGPKTILENYINTVYNLI